jgi:hypothetical protein
MAVPAYQSGDGVNGAKSRSAVGARSGQGLRLVAAVARDWGVEPRPDGKTV